MNDRARQAFVGRRLSTLKEVPISVSPTRSVTVSLHIETSAWAAPVLRVERTRHEPVRLPFAALYHSKRGRLTEKQYYIASQLRRNFAAELAAYQVSRVTALPLTNAHLVWQDQTEGYVTIPSRFGVVYLYREPRNCAARLILVEAPTGHALETALCANDGAPVKIWLAPTMDFYHTEVRANRNSRPESILRRFLQSQFPQPLDINLSEGVSSHG